MNSKTFALLEFDKVRERLAAYASFAGGLALVRTFRPALTLEEAQQRQRETAEAVALFESAAAVTIGGARDIREAADNARRGFTLLPHQLLDIRSTLRAAHNLRAALIRLEEKYPRLATVAATIPDCPGLAELIDQTIDEHGDILDSASPKLSQIRQQLHIAYNRIQSKLQSILHGDQSQFLQEALITSRNGRYVVPLKADAKGRIPGIVHDQSGSGATLWVEPMATVEHNNQYRALQADEEDEIRRILADLSKKTAVHAEPLKQIVDQMAILDLIFARARYAIAIDAVEPTFVPWRRYKKGDTAAYHPGSTLAIRAARHPLLDPETVVPTDILLDDETFMVLITGPNTGGKTVSLKTVGLMVLMAQSGMHLPAREARLTLFDKIYADIGDEQSIEQSLSTFSSHMTNVITILKEANDRSLILLDELGSGTDPSEGAALAQAIVHYMRDLGATTFVATHFPALKLYASQTSGVTNASLLFNIETLSPTHEMVIGVPGRSNALAISRRLGLNEEILADAARMLGSETEEADQVLDSLYDMQEKISSQEAASRINLLRLQKERDALAERLAGIEAERLEILTEARKQVRQELSEMRREMRRLRKQTPASSTHKEIKQVTQTLHELEAALPNLQPHPAANAEEAIPPHILQPGDRVFVKTVQALGEIITIQKEMAEIAVGRMHLKAHLDDLEWRPLAESDKPQSALDGIQIKKATSPGLELDIRGLRAEAALPKVEQYLDRAFLAALPWVRIIHGKGSGRLRDVVRKKLTKHPHISGWRTGKEGEGGTGVTIATLIE